MKTDIDKEEPENITKEYGATYYYEKCKKQFKSDWQQNTTQELLDWDYE